MATNTSTYKMNHTMIRIKDPKETIEFYKKHFGMSLINKMDFPDSKFTLYFLGFDYEGAPSAGKQWTDRQGLLELTHNYGTENDSNYKVNNGNSDPYRGFGHICFSVPSIEKVCKSLEENEVKFQKRLTDGRQKNIAFALDPNGYWIELISNDNVNSFNISKPYRFNHSMIRVRDPKKSIKFYQDILGMTLIRTAEHEAAKFTLYFFAYTQGDNNKTECENSDREGLIELTWNWGTEKDDSFQGYHNGNDAPQGFGHFCISVDDLDSACERFEKLQVNWKKRLTDGKMKNVAFILDPDNYWIEVIQNEELKSRAKW